MLFLEFTSSKKNAIENFPQKKWIASKWMRNVERPAGGFSCGRIVVSPLNRETSRIHKLSNRPLAKTIWIIKWWKFESNEFEPIGLKSDGLIILYSSRDPYFEVIFCAPALRKNISHISDMDRCMPEQIQGFGSGKNWITIRKVWANVSLFVQEDRGKTSSNLGQEKNLKKLGFFLMAV